MRFKCQFVVLLIFFGTLSTASADNFAAISPKIVDYGLKAIKAIISAVTVIDNSNFHENVVNSLKAIEESTERIEALITTEANRIIEELSVKIDMQNVFEFVRTAQKINRRFEKEFMRYFAGNDSYQPETIETYINATINPSDFGATLSLINQYVIPSEIVGHIEDKKIFQVLHDYMQIKVNHALDCDEGQSANQQLFEVYNFAIAALTKGYIMVVHAYKYRQLQASDPNAWKSELRDAMADYKESVFKITEAARLVMNTQSKVIRRCDAKVYKEDVNYKRYTFLSTYIASPDVLFYTKRPQEICDGTSCDCRRNDNIRWVCFALLETGRRYEYLYEMTRWTVTKYLKGRYIDNCDGGNIYAGNTDVCICEEPFSPKKGALFNMTAKYTDIANNRVVTGIRFVSKGTITTIEIQDGKLVNGTVDPTTVRWNQDVNQNLKNYEYLNYVTPDKDNILDLRYSRQFSLDDIILPAGMIITGVKFVEINNRISLMVAGLRIFDKLGHSFSSSEMEWFSANDLGRSEINLKNHDIPTFSKKENREISKPGKNYVKFQMSDWYYDVSQTVIPFMDLTEVVTSPPTPLGGIGIFYKGQQRYGGFIALKLLSFDNTILMNDKHLNDLFNNNTVSGLN